MQNYRISFEASLSEDDVRAMNKCFFDAMEESMEISGCHNLKLTPIDEGSGLVRCGVCVVPSLRVALIEGYLKNEPANKGECLDEDERHTETIRFSDGYQMDIQVCGVQYDPDASTNCAWSQAVLYDQNGCELTCTEPSDDFHGEWRLVYDGTLYIGIVTTGKKMN